MDLDFNAEEWIGMSTAQRVRLCKLLAIRAREIARRSSPDLAPAHLRIADEWDKLAGEMERET
jgi:hypothetical protein